MHIAKGGAMMRCLVTSRSNAIVTWIGLVATAASVTAADQKVRIIVRVPAETPQADSIYVAGSLPAVGNWRPDGLKLKRQPNGDYQADIDLPSGQTLEFKITRGSWASVEKKA